MRLWPAHSPTALHNTSHLAVQRAGCRETRFHPLCLHACSPRPQCHTWTRPDRTASVVAAAAAAAVTAAAVTAVDIAAVSRCWGHDGAVPDLMASARLLAVSPSSPLPPWATKHQLAMSQRTGLAGPCLSTIGIFHRPPR
ncbi:hypothetical protein GRF29_19g1417565 [Pseudopithomyces chartarum]|uniref:Uncharacterized protein n=1 Tax=Pseudopithomyces chartarum TaxID=1892770 RepID=A0AAN6M2Z1_9PLEO|nr:hypothetical protein GRF29_19g1417565 [Pseudopithomyces chartarum]